MALVLGARDADLLPRSSRLGRSTWSSVRRSPPTTRASASSRSARKEAALARDYEVCPACFKPVEKDFLICPSCMKKLRKPCIECGKRAQARLGRLPVLQDEAVAHVAESRRPTPPRRARGGCVIEKERRAMPEITVNLPDGSDQVRPRGRDRPRRRRGHRPAPRPGRARRQGRRRRSST